jgi:hypothetical protein
MDDSDMMDEERPQSPQKMPTATAINKDAHQENTTDSDDDIDMYTDGEGDPVQRDPSPTPSTESTPEPNEGRPNIASLCNPYDEGTDIRQPQASSLFSKNLDAIRKPSWIKDSNCEQLFIFSLFEFTNHTLSGIQSFF